MTSYQHTNRVTGQTKTYRLTLTQYLYLEKAAWRGFERGQDGYGSTVTVRILQERGLLLLSQAGDSWRVQGVTPAGQKVLDDNPKAPKQ